MAAFAGHEHAVAVLGSALGFRYWDSLVLDQGCEDHVSDFAWEVEEW